MRIKTFAILIAFALILAACGASEAAAPTTAAAAATQSDNTVTDDQITDTEMTDTEMTDDEMTDDEMTEDEMAAATHSSFTVTITNTSADTELATPLAPGAYAVHTSMDTIFAEGQPDRGEGLEALAEDGDPSALAASLEGTDTVISAGVFANPDGGSEAGPALPGSSYSFTFLAAPGDYLSFATMFVQSNDWFFAPASSGINLFDGDTPLEGDITDMVFLWDAGTEVDETPGEGANQPPRQAGPDTGDDQNGSIKMVDGSGVTVTISVAG